MKSRLVILTMLVIGMLLSTAGAGLAITGLSGNNDASIAGYPTTAVSPGGSGVLGAQDEAAGNGVSPADEGGGGAAPSDNAGGGGSGTQPSRQVEAGAGSGSGGELPFTGFAAIPILFGGLVLLGSGLVLRSRSASDR